MTEPQTLKKGFRWGRFAATFIIILVIAELGGRSDRNVSERSFQVSYEIGRAFGALILALLVYAIDSLILRKRQKGKGGSADSRRDRRQ